jgi:hypothetical protein
MNSISSTSYRNRITRSGFVGSVDGPWGQVPPYAMVCMPHPLPPCCRSIMEYCRRGKGFSVEQLKEEIAATDR